MRTIPIGELECCDGDCEKQATHEYELTEIPTFFCDEHAAERHADHISPLPGHDDLGPNGTVARVRYTAMQVNKKIPGWSYYAFIPLALLSNEIRGLRPIVAVFLVVAVIGLIGSRCESGRFIDEYGNLER